MSIAKRKLQLVVDKLTKWADSDGFHFSKDKTYVLFIFATNKILTLFLPK